MQSHFEPIKVLAGAVIRHFLSGLAALLLAYGVTQEQADAAVNSAVLIALAVLTFLASLVWSYISKWIAFDTIPEDENHAN